MRRTPLEALVGPGGDEITHGDVAHGHLASLFAILPTSQIGPRDDTNEPALRRPPPSAPRRVPPGAAGRARWGCLSRDKPRRGQHHLPDPRTLQRISQRCATAAWHAPLRVDDLARWKWTGFRTWRWRIPGDVPLQTASERSLRRSHYELAQLRNLQQLRNGAGSSAMPSSRSGSASSTTASWRTPARVMRSHAW